MKLIDLNYTRFSSASQTRGLTYFKNGMVVDFHMDGFKASAAVHGTRDYHTSITFSPKGKIVSSSCDCPYSGFGLCKHVAALVYACDANGGLATMGGAPIPQRNDVQTFLAEINSEILHVKSGEYLAFFEQKEKEFLALLPGWTLRQRYDNLVSLFTLTVPYNSGIKTFDLYLDFAEGSDEALELVDGTFSRMYARYPNEDFLEKALSSKRLNHAINEAIREDIGKNTSLRNSIHNDFDRFGPYLEEQTFIAIINKTYYTYYLNTSGILRQILSKDYIDALHAFNDRGLSLSPSDYLMLADYFEEKGDREEAKKAYKTLLKQAKDLPFSLFKNYWNILSDAEKRKEFDSVYRSADYSKHGKSFKVMIGSATKADMKAVPALDYLYLEKEIKASFAPDVYLNPLLTKLRKKLLSPSSSYDDLQDCLKVMALFPIALSTFAKYDPEVMGFLLGDTDLRRRLVPMLRDASLLEEAHIYSYPLKEKEDVSRAS